MTSARVSGRAQSDRQRAGESFSLDNLAYIAAAEGRVDDAFAILNQAVINGLSMCCGSPSTLASIRCERIHDSISC